MKTARTIIGNDLIIQADKVGETIVLTKEMSKERVIIIKDVTGKASEENITIEVHESGLHILGKESCKIVSDYGYIKLTSDGQKGLY
jgi:HSP20 family molecular chaperone IbpA